MIAPSDLRMCVVAECPVCPGAGCVVALNVVGDAKLVYFAPCCGIAWWEAPLHGRIDQITSLADLGVATVALPTKGEVEAEGLRVLRQEPLDAWADTIPLAKR